jgi:hypothetical protein
VKELAGSEPTGSLSRVLEEKAKSVDFESGAVKQKIHDKTKTLNAVLSLTQVLFIGLAFMALYNGSRKYYVEHVVMALYFVSFFLIVLTALSLLAFGTIKALGYAGASDTARHIVLRGVQFWIPLAVLGGYLFLAFRRFYGSSAVRALVAAPVVLVISIAVQNMLSWVGFLLIISTL